MKNYHVEAFDERGRDLLPPRILLLIKDRDNETLIETAKREVGALVSSHVSYYVITELSSIPEE